MECKGQRVARNAGLIDHQMEGSSNRGNKHSLLRFFFVFVVLFCFLFSFLVLNSLGFTIKSIIDKSTVTDS